MAKRSSTKQVTNAPTADVGAKNAPSGQIGQISQMAQMVKDYARQETLGPLKGAGRWAAFGGAGAVLLGTGCAFLILGLLRLVQTEYGVTFRGKWMGLLPYLLALVVSVIVIGVAASRIGKKTLQKEKR